MTIYWDSSALVAALHDEALRRKMEKGAHCTRTHSLSEIFSTLTGGRLGFRYSPDESSAMIASLAADLMLTDLETGEVLAAFEVAQSLGVRGGRVHDYLHAVAASKVCADRIWTFNRGDFEGLAGPIAIESP